MLVITGIGMASTVLDGLQTPVKDPFGLSTRSPFGNNTAPSIPIISWSCLSSTSSIWSYRWDRTVNDSKPESGNCEFIDPMIFILLRRLWLFTRDYSETGHVSPESMKRILILVPDGSNSLGARTLDTFARDPPRTCPQVASDCISEIC